MKTDWSLEQIVAQLECCGYECQAGPLGNNIAFKALQDFIGEAKEPIPQLKGTKVLCLYFDKESEREAVIESFASMNGIRSLRIN